MSKPTESVTFALSTGEEGERHYSASPAVSGRSRRILGTVVAGLVCLGLSVGTPTPHQPPDSAASDLPMAMVYRTCMQKWKLPFSIPTPGGNNGFTSTISDGSWHTVVWRDAYGHVFSGALMSSRMSDGNPMEDDDDESSAVSASLNAQVDVLIALFTTPALFIDQVNYSMQYNQCLDESGYTDLAARGGKEPEIFPPDLSDEDKAQMENAIQAQIRANKQWAACAREHGWPVPDPTYTRGKDLLEAKLPSSITEGQLRWLLSKCPTFDPVQQDRLLEWTQVHPDQSILDYPGVISGASVGFRLTGFDALLSPELMSDTERNALIGKLARLNLILREKRDAYIEQHEE